MKRTGSLDVGSGSVDKVIVHLVVGNQMHFAVLVDSGTIEFT